MEYVHTQHCQRGGQRGQQAGGAVQDGVENVAALQHDEDAAGKAHRQRAGREVGHAAAEQAAKAVEAHPGHKAHDDAHAQEQGRKLVDIPAPLEHAHDQQGEGGAHDQQDQLPGARQLRKIV